MKIITVLAALIVLSGCVKTRQQLKAESGDGDLTRQTRTQQREQARSGSQPAVQPVYKEKAPPAAYRFEEYDENMRQMNGRIDTIENHLNQINASQAGEKEATTSMAKAIDDKFLAYEEELKKLSAQVQQLSDQIAAGPLKSAAAAPKAGSAKRTPFDEGEAQFDGKNWRQAIVSYQKYRDGYPKGKMYPEATYKIGVCFQELKMKDEAKAFFDEVTTKFPGSKEAKKAAFRAKSLK